MQGCLSASAAAGPLHAAARSRRVSMSPGSQSGGVVPGRDAGLRVTARVSLLPVDVRRLARDERADFAAFLATLPPRQWDAPTLCAEWRVRDVVAHVVGYDELDARGLLECVGAT